ncbi:hypothetical protein [Acidithiobacillus ferrooxidans]|uniref:Lipoprotein n=1 Tax=Acidithiobacillus ferrooxidans TaxID=920 RepID=A0A2W1KST6_ACIFR|nr:hypothetical protein [Acidithiobacillus ferrooxidans]MBU2816339.1 hypothetical protein [Acidithiobacillus ferrooxidans]MCR1344003.1 hypothetical protein [Acidithiobacillus ferrooxidans]PZD82381.1 hypothetical protein DN052_05020 [Acidithiobacillus ferrooxidans]QLK41345.1 hypothetical protein FE661_03545 [Acidithiobacillus ferrooxidans]QZT53287.1 hypothetical protein K7B00_03545 [Acidithiobacillus ferrooxidans]
MNRIVKIATVSIIVALSGCASHHHEAPKQLTSKQANENIVKSMFSGGPLTSKAPSLAAYSLSGYGSPPKSK